MINILILGASSDIGLNLLDLISKNKKYRIGAHCNTGFKRLKKYSTNNKKRFKIFSKNLIRKKDCNQLVSSYLHWSKGIDVLIQLNGKISSKDNWQNLEEKKWNDDLAINLSAPFFISQYIFNKMKKKGGKIIFTSTSSADKGGGGNSVGYGIAKLGLMSLTKLLAKEGGKHKIKVNCIAPGFILTRLHTKKLKKNNQAIRKRKSMNVLNDVGTPGEVASLIEYLISNKTNFITGEVIRVDGGDWL